MYHFYLTNTKAEKMEGFNVLVYVNVEFASYVCVCV